MSINIKERQRIEKKIVTAVVDAALKEGYTVIINNGGDDDEITSTDRAKILKEMFATDEERLYVAKDGKIVGWVFFVYGECGWDVICDYTTNLEEMLKPALALADKYGG